jgi:hypothetical protein
MDILNLKYLNYILILIIILIWIQIYTVESSELRLSPSFPPENIGDETRDWRNMVTGNKTSGSDATDINSVSYSSDGKFLNATIWFTDMDALKNFNENKSNHSKFIYGILIDGDANSNTGFLGMEYFTEYRYSDDSSSWERSFCKLSMTGKKACKNNIIDFNDFFHLKEDNIDMFIDLKDIFYPLEYRIFFYSICEDKSRLGEAALDAIRYVYIPPPEFEIDISPDNAKIKVGKKQTFEVEVSTVTNLTPNITLSITEYPTDEIEEIYFEHPILKMHPKLKSAKTDLGIKVKADANERINSSLIVEGNLVFPTEYYRSPPSLKTQHPVKIPVESKNETIYSDKILLTIEEEKPVGEKIIGWLNILSNPLATIGAAATLISAILGLNIWKKRREKNQSEQKGGSKEGNP